MISLKKNWFIIVKYIYLTICFVCFCNYFASTLQFIDNFLIEIRYFLPIIGIILLLFSQNVDLKINKVTIMILVLSYCFGTCIGNNGICNEYIILVILGLLFSYENPKIVFKYILILFIIYLSSSLILSHLNIFSNIIIMRGDSPRYSFNFFHPNVLGMFFVSLYCLVCFVYPHYKFLIITLGLLFFSFICFYVDSRTNSLLILLVFLIHLFYWIYQDINRYFNFNYEWLFKILKLLIVCFPLICLLFSIITSIAYSPENLLISKLNSLLTGRIASQHTAYINHGIPLLGLQKVFNERFYDIIDNFFVFTIYKFGFIFEVVIISLFTILIHKKINTKNCFNCFWLIIILSLYGLTEPFLMYFCCNPFLLLLFNNYRNKEDVLDE